MLFSQKSINFDRNTKSFVSQYSLVNFCFSHYFLYPICITKLLEWVLQPQVSHGYILQFDQCDSLRRYSQVLRYNCLGQAWQVPKCLSICLKSLLKLNIRSSALPRSAPCPWDQISDLQPLFWPSLPSKVKTDQPIFKGPSLINSFELVY